jgi:hypothetical protein
VNANRVPRSIFWLSGNPVFCRKNTISERRMGENASGILANRCKIGLTAEVYAVSVHCMNSRVEMVRDAILTAGTPKPLI